jgi:hypothetical protein
MILNGELEKKIDFIDESVVEETKDNGRLTESTKFVEIVFENMKELFPDNL